MNHGDSIAVLVHWLYKKDYYIEFSRNGEDSVDRTNRFVSINNTRSLETQLHVILHECGHILVFESDKVVNGIRDVLSKYSAKSKIHKTFTVVEEVEAWKRGLSLANRLGIPIDKIKWDKDVARAIYKYMLWATGSLGS
jgi:hypothetical protein